MDGGLSQYGVLRRMGITARREATCTYTNCSTESLQQHKKVVSFERDDNNHNIELFTVINNTKEFTPIVAYRLALDYKELAHYQINSRKIVTNLTMAQQPPARARGGAPPQNPFDGVLTHILQVWIGVPQANISNHQLLMALMQQGVLVLRDFIDLTHDDINGLFYYTRINQVPSYKV